MEAVEDGISGEARSSPRRVGSCRASRGRYLAAPVSTGAEPLQDAGAIARLGVEAAEAFLSRSEAARTLTEFQDVFSSADVNSQLGRRADGLHILLQYAYMKVADAQNLRSAGPYQRAMLQLLSRAARTMHEILALMHLGFSQGMLGRWRTLYECQVFVTLLRDLDVGVPGKQSVSLNEAQAKAHGVADKGRTASELLAQRFLDRGLLEDLEVARRYEKIYGKSASLPAHEARWAQVSLRYDAADPILDKRDAYGWALPLIPNAQYRTFGTIVNRAKIEPELHMLYAVACKELHVNGSVDTNVEHRQAGALSGGLNLIEVALMSRASFGTVLRTTAAVLHDPLAPGSRLHATGLLLNEAYMLEHISNQAEVLLVGSP